MVRTCALENHALLLLEDVSSADTVSIGFWLKAGARDERNGERGFSHFLEHMLFKGTERRNAFEIARSIDRVGGILNAFTENEFTCFYCTLPAEDLDLAVDILTDMVFHSVLDSMEFEKEKSVILNEVLSYMDMPEQVTHEVYLSNMWGNHPLAMKITGEIGEIKAVTIERLESFYRERYVPSNLIVSVAGCFHPDRLIELITEALASQKNSAFKVNRIPPERQRSWKYQKGHCKQVHIYTGTDLPLDNVSLLYAIQVFSTVMGESMSSRLFQEIREKRALCYSISCFRTLFSDCSLWTVYANTKPGQVKLLITSLNEEFHRLLSQPFTEEEVMDAKSYLKGSLILAKEDMEVRMKRLVRLQQIIGKTMEYEESLLFIDSVAAGEVKEISRAITDSSRFNLLAYGGRRVHGFNAAAFDF